MSRLSVSLASLSLGLTACTVGPTLAEFKPAHSPAGVHTRVNVHRNILRDNKVAGELLAVQGDGLLILSQEPVLPDTSGARLVLVPFRMMRSIRIEQVGSFSIKSEGKEMDESRKARLQMLSRYPQGVSDELLQKLLASHVQSAVDVPSRQE
jgi:hypothetical protein